MDSLATGKTTSWSTRAEWNRAFDRVERGLKDLADGKPVIVLDGADRENEGDLIFAAEKATPELLSFVIRHTSGYVCVALAGADCDRLDLPPMHHTNTDGFRTAFTVTVDARHGVTTGISAIDRARTIRLLAQNGTEPDDLVRPGHVLPLRAVDGGVLVRPGHTEAATDLARMAGLAPVGTLCEIVSPVDETRMARSDELAAFADEHDLTLISIADLIEYRQRFETHVEHRASVQLSTRRGAFVAHGYQSVLDNLEHLALVRGAIGNGEDILVRVHSECLTGDVFGSRCCDCGSQLDGALSAVADEGRGVVLYLRGHEGRGIGLVNKLRAYRVQQAGADTVDANLELGLPVDARDYATAAQILLDLGVRSVRLLTNNPDKHAALERYGLRVLDRVHLPVVTTPENIRYLSAKRDRLGHDLPGLGAADPVPLDLPAPGSIWGGKRC